MDETVSADSRMQAVVGRIDFSKIPGLTDEGSADVSIAIHELESRSIILWGRGLEAFIQAYHEEFTADELPLNSEELEERFVVAFDEGTQPMTRYLLKSALRRQPALSLSDLAALRYKKNSASFHKMSRHMRDRIMWPMRDLGLWSVVVTDRVAKGKSEVASYAISAGRVLLAFDSYIYQPWRRQQLVTFYARFLKES